jgi:hypothetical protein
MLFMVIESFKDRAAIGERFRREGRMLPEGVTYHASWVEPTGARCSQVMEAPQRESLNAWTSRWSDVMEFEIVPVETSSDFWKSYFPNTRKSSK